MPKGIMLTPEQQEERREEIISVALQLIEKNGFQKRVCQVFCVSFKKKFYGEGNLPIVKEFYTFVN